MSDWLDINKAIPWLEGQQFNIIEKNDLAKIQAKLDSLDFEIYVFDGKKVINQDSFFEQVSDDLKFPKHFGRNWNAFIDCLRNFELQSARRVAIIWTDSESLLQKDIRTFLEAVYWFRHIAYELGSIREDGSRPLQILIILTMENTVE
jgi:RNAse (barnase) inhibitor barstar